MFKIRREHMEAFRPVVRAQLPNRILADLQKQGMRAEREPATGTVIATDPRGFQTRLSFYPDGLPARLTQPSGATYAFEHDGEGRLAALTYPGGERVETKRDARGNVVEIRRPGLLSYQLEHDENDRLLSAHYPDGTAVRLTYHPEGPLDSLTDRAGATTRYRRDSDGKLQAIVDPLGRETVFETDEEGKLFAVAFPDGSKQEYAFDPERRAATITQRAGGIVVQQLDEKDRLKAIQWSDGSRTEFQFDEEGRVVAARSESGEIVQTFDAAGDPLTETTRDGTVTYTYDPEGRLLRLTTPFGDSIQYEYDGDGRLIVVRDWEGRENRLSYAADGAVAEIRYANGLTEKQEHGRLGRIQHSTVSDSRKRLLGEQAYEYDLNDKLVGYEEILDTSLQRLSRRFEYDAESHITAEIDLSSKRALHRYQYDLKGNLTDVNGTPVEVGLLDEPTRFGGAEIGYDGNGNVTHLPSPRGPVRCEFSENGTLHKATIGQTAIRFEYDALGRRITKTDGLSTWRYGWAGYQLLWEEYFENGTAIGVRRDYIFWPASLTPLLFRENDQTYYLQTDARGAVVRAFNTLGAIVWSATYDSFGSVTIAVEKVRQPWRLPGHYEDSETGLHHTYARYYCPWTKSYLSRDPLWNQPGSTNYSYSCNDPWNRVDPVGAFPPLLVAMGVGAVVGAVAGAVIGGVAAAIRHDDILAGARDGAITGAVAGALFPVVVAAAAVMAPVAAAGVLAGELTAGALLLGSFASGVSTFFGSLARQFLDGDPICFVCALKEAALAALLFPAGAALAKGLGRVLGRLGRLSLKSSKSRLVTVGGRRPVNYRYAGKTYPASKLPVKLRGKYPNGVEFNEKGFPDFSPWKKASFKSKKLTGDYNLDAARANKKIGAATTPKDYVWHHIEDGKTMILIPKDIHNAVRHTGGSAIIKKGIP